MARNRYFSPQDRQDWMLLRHAIPISGDGRPPILKRELSEQLGIKMHRVDRALRYGRYVALPNEASELSLTSGRNGLQFVRGEDDVAAIRVSEVWWLTHIVTRMETTKYALSDPLVRARSKLPGDGVKRFQRHLDVLIADADDLLSEAE